MDQAVTLWQKAETDMDWEEAMRDMRRHLAVFNRAKPATAHGFAELSKGARVGSSLDHKTMELVALGIAVSTRCEPCVGFHVEALIEAEATREEVADVLAVCVQMGGGPSLMYAAKALDAWDQFNAD